MIREQYPSTEDLRSFMQAHRVEIPETLDLTSVIRSAVSFWETKTGWRPFLKEEQERIQTFCKPSSQGRSYVLDLGGGLLHLTDLSIGDHPLEIEKDFIPMPIYAEEKGRPYEWVKFSKRVLDYEGAVRIKGLWGFGNHVPEEVWYALLKFAASEILSVGSTASHTGLTQWSEGDVKEQYSKDPYKGVIEEYRQSFGELVKEYKRWGI